MTEPPKIEDANAKIGTLERRAGHLQRRLDVPSYRSSAAADYDRAEVAALRDGIAAIQYVITTRTDTRRNG